MQLDHDVSFEEIKASNDRERESMTFHFFVLGTAIRPSANTVSETVPRGLTIVPLKKMSK